MIFFNPTQTFHQIQLCTLGVSRGIHSENFVCRDGDVDLLSKQ